MSKNLKESTSYSIENVYNHARRAVALHAYFMENMQLLARCNFFV